MDKMRGFSLIEMMLVIAILAVLAGVAIPNLRAMIASSRQTSIANLYIASFHLARNAAINRSNEIDITAIGGDWKKGWQITTVEPVGTPPTLLASYEPLADEIYISELPDETSAPVVSFRYNRQGRLSLVDGAAMAGSVTITICDKREGEMGRQILFEPIGRASISTVTCR